MTKLYELLNIKHPEMENKEWQFKFLEDSYTGEGGYAWAKPVSDSSTFGKGNKQNLNYSYDSNYLDRFFAERKDAFVDRLHATTYINYIKPIIDLYNDFLFRRSASRKTNKAELQNWLVNNDIVDIVSKIMHDAQLYGTGYLLLDVENFQADNFQDAIDGGFNGIYPNRINPKDVLGWKLNDDASFEWFKYRVTTVNLANPIAEPEYKTTWVIWYPDKYQVFEMIENNEEDKDAALIIEGANPFGVVPIVPLKYQEAEDGSFLGESQVLATARLNKDYYNRLSELVTILRSQTFSILVLPVPEGTAQNSQLDIGPNNIITVENTSQVKPEFISGDSANADIYEKRLFELQNEILRVSSLEWMKSLMTGRLQGNVSSGDSRRFSFSMTNSKLVKMGKQAELFELRMMEIIASYYGIESDYDVNYPQDYEISAGLNNIEALKEAINVGMPKVIVDKLLLKAGQQLTYLGQDELELAEKELNQLPDTDTA